MPMKSILLCYFLLAFLPGCASTVFFGSTPPGGAPRAFQATVQTDLAGTSASVPPGQQSTETPTAAALPYSRTLTAPTVLDRFELLHLPGAGRGPYALARLGDKLYVANSASDNIAVVQNDRAIKFIPTARDPQALASDPARGRVYVGTFYTPTLALIENDTVARQVQVGAPVTALAVNGDDLYVGYDDKPRIERRDVNTLEKKDEFSLSRGFSINSLVVDPARNRLYVSVFENIAALDLADRRELFWMEVPYNTGAFAVNAGDGSIWGGMYDEKTSQSYVRGFGMDGKPVAQILVGGSGYVRTFDDKGRLYVLNSERNQVQVLDPARQQIIANLPVNEESKAALYDSDSQSLYVANYDSDNLTAIDTTRVSVRATIPLALAVHVLLSNPDRRRVYAANGSTNSVFVIEGNQVVREIPVGNVPVDLARDPQTDRVFVATRADGRLSVIDENSLSVTASDFITDYLRTVAVDPVHRKLFAGSLEFNLDTRVRGSVYLSRGATIGSLNPAAYLRVNPALEKIYTVAYNGTPGSNSRYTLYAFEYGKPGESKLLGSRVGGNTTALEIDPSTNNLYETALHPLALTNELDVFDANDKVISTLAMPSRTRGMASNPATHHLFLTHSGTYQPVPSVTPPRDNTVEVMDTRSLGTVAFLDVPGDPSAITIMDGLVYVAGFSDGTITVIGDAETGEPPAPTPTLTPTPYPTWTPSPTPIASSTPVPTVISAAACSIPAAEPLVPRVAELGTQLLGCPTAPPAFDDHFAYQPLATGFLIDDFRDEQTKKVYAFSEGKYEILPDTWRESDPEDQCPGVSVPMGQVRPKRGFGKVWCENPAVQALGGGLSEERAVRAVIQSFERATLWALAGVRVVALFSDGTWK